MTELPYHRACGPKALAAIAGRSEFVIADELLRLQRDRGRATAPGTMVDDMHYWLITRGYAVEPWDLETDRPARSADDYADSVLLEPAGPPVETSIVERVAVRFPDVPRETIISTIDEYMGERPKLSPWVTAHPAGTFLVHVDGHYLAVRDGTVISGDDNLMTTYAAHAVLQVERITRRATA